MFFLFISFVLNSVDSATGIEMGIGSNLAEL